MPSIVFFFFFPTYSLKACSGRILMSGCSGKKVIWAFHIQRKSQLKRIGYSDIYKKLCFRMRSLSWHSGVCKKEWFCIYLDSFVTEMDRDVFCATLVFTIKYVAPLSIRKSIRSFPTVSFTLGSCGEIVIGCLKSKRESELLHSSELSFLSAAWNTPIFLCFVLVF